MTQQNPAFVTADWLEKNLHTPGLSIVDAAWYLPSQGRNAAGEYEAGHIPGAVFFDHDKVVEPGSALPHTLPSPENFARFAGTMGISDQDTIVVYDGFGVWSSVRARWMFRAMGAEKVFILEGGLDGWKRDGRSLTADITKIAPTVFNVNFDAGRVASLEDMREIVASGAMQIADARPAGRFQGVDPEPRPGLRGGHMPGARNIPFASFSKDGKIVGKNELKQQLETAGLDLSKPVVTSCGSGVSAAIISLALETLGHKDNKLYDGSWAEWGGLADTPVVTGPADKNA